MSAPLKPFKRPDSPYWWYWLRGPGVGPRKINTKIRIGVTATEQRDGELLATQMMLDHMEREKQGLTAPPEKPAEVSFADLATWWRTDVLPTHKGKEREAEILPRFEAEFGHLPATAISKKLAMAWRTTRMATPTTVKHFGGPNGKRHTFPPPSARTVNREVAVLQQVLSDGVKADLITASPLAGLADLKTAPVLRRTMSEDEETRILAQLAVPDQAMVLMGLTMLVRFSDILDFRRADDHGDFVTIRDPKNGAANTPPVASRLRKLLDAIPVDPFHPEYYFAHRRGGKSERNRRSAFRKALQTACKRAKVPYGKKLRGITFHWATRRTGATRMIRRGGSQVLGVVQKIGNWKDLNVLVGIYQETNSDEMRAAVESVSDTSPMPATPTTSMLKTRRKTNLRRVK